MPDNAEVCCLLEICCGDDPQKARHALAQWLEHHAKLSHDDAARTANVFLDNFAVADRTLIPFIHKVAELVREHPEYA